MLTGTSAFSDQSVTVGVLAVNQLEEFQIELMKCLSDAVLVP